MDISSYQATTPGLGGLAFVIVRASIGMTTDAMYATHAKAVRKAGLELGAYHFGRNLAVGPQVKAFQSAYAAVPPDFIALDLEGSGPTAMTKAQAAQFIAATQWCGLYGSESGYPDLGQSFRWVANWSKQPTIPWDIWQYTSSGKRPAYSGRVDLDRFDGTLAEFQTVTRGHTGGGNVPGDEMVHFPAYDIPNICDLPAGTKLYGDSDFTEPPVGGVLGAARTLPYLGSWTPPGGVTAHIVVHGATAWYIKPSALPAHPYVRPGADCSAQDSTIAAQKATIADREDRLHRVNVLSTI